MRKVAVILSDLHCASKIGLLMPETVLYDENGEPYQPNLTEVQKWLLECYEKDIESVKELAADSPLYLIVNGDITHGMKYPEGLIDDNIYNHAKIAAVCLDRWASLPNLRAMRLIHGTVAHEMTGCGLSALVASALALMHSNLNVKVLRHALFDINGVTFDCAHHGPGVGIRTWTNGNQLRYYLKSLMLEEIIAGNKPPDIVVRSHVHTYAHERVEIHGNNNEDVCVSDGYVTPSYCGMGLHGQQMTRSAQWLSSGLVAFEILDKHVEAYPFWRKIDLRTKETL